MIAKFKKSGKRNYDFLTKAGPQFQDAIFKFWLRMFKEEDFPEEFQNTTLHMIFIKGGKGRKEILLDSRFICWPCTSGTWTRSPWPIKSIWSSRPRAGPASPQR